MTLRIGIDLGGTKIEGIALDRNGTELWRKRIATPQGDYKRTLAAVAGLVARIERDTGQQGTVGIATPGAVSTLTGRMKNSNSTCLNDRPLPDDLAALLGRPVRIANDADCFALSEATDGAGAGYDSVFGVILGTGVGGGLVLGGRLLQGANRIAGEWGHNPQPGIMDEPQRPCYCGRSNCVETFLSGPGLERSYHHAAGQWLSARQIADYAATGETLATAVLERYCDSLARALAMVINIVDPQVIVLGGGIGNIAMLYQHLPERLGCYVFSDTIQTQIVPPLYGDSSGVRGAAWLWNTCSL